MVDQTIPGICEDGQAASLEAIDARSELAELRQHVKDFLCALDRGYFPWDGKSAFVDALRGAVS